MSEEMTEEECAAVDELIYCLTQFQMNPGPGTLYALEMAKEELELLGIDPDEFLKGGDDE